MTKKIRRGSLFLLAAFLGPLPALADPPFRDVLFEVPLALTDLPAIISKVAIQCDVKIRYVTPATNGSDLVRTGQTEANVVGGAVNQTMQVLVTIPSVTRVAAAGMAPISSYTCKLRAFLDEGLGWNDFVNLSARSGRSTPLPSELELAYPNPISFPQAPQDALVSGPIQWPASP